ncbi:hypothetical protein KF840_03650 [bacterium]|nr:hypothetical protein [bacterium]
MGGTVPGPQACHAPDSLLGSGTTSGAGRFEIAIAPPLAPGACVYAVDTCTMLTSAVECATSAAPAPALGPRALLLALAALMAVAVVGLRRRPL